MAGTWRLQDGGGRGLAVWHMVTGSIHSDELTLEGIKQFFVAVEREEWKFDTLCDLYDTLTITQAVIFCNTKRKVCALSCPALPCWCLPMAMVVTIYLSWASPNHDGKGKAWVQLCAFAGGLADREDARSQLHGVLYARRHAPEGTGVHHEGVPLGRQVLAHFLSLSPLSCIVPGIANCLLSVFCHFIQLFQGLALNQLHARPASAHHTASPTLSAGSVPHGPGEAP